MEEFQFGLRSNTAATGASTALALHEQVAAVLVLPLLQVFLVLPQHEGGLTAICWNILGNFNGTSFDQAATFLSVWCP